jgi:hypothetical protein
MANTAPIFTLTPNIGVAQPANANTKSDGTGNLTSSITMYKAFIAGTSGSFISEIRWIPVATTASSAVAQTVGRVFLSTISTGATTGGVDTWLYNEQNLPAVTADGTANPMYAIIIPVMIAIPAGWFIHVATHAAPNAATAWQAMIVGGDY